MKYVTYVAFCAAMMVNTAAVQAADKPEDFAVHFTVQIAKDASLQRLTLPKEAMAALQTANAADVRLFNGSGQPVPIAQIPRRNLSVASQPQGWPIYPVMATTKQQSMGSLSLRFEKTADRSMVHVEDGAETKLETSSTKQIATLVDTRPIKSALAELTVDAELTQGEQVALTITASKDLKNWRTLAQDVPVFRFGPTADAPGSMRVPLMGMHLENEYLRISWPPEAVFTLRGVRITLAASTAAPQRLAVPLIGMPDGSSFVFTLPFATPIQALDIRPTDPNMLVPVQLSGRTTHGEPWRPLASGIVYRMKAEGTESLSPPIELNGASLRELRIEPTANTTGFATAPQVSALLAPLEWVFLASGGPPFILAIGRVGAETTQLPLASLIPGYTPGAELKLPVAIVDLASAATQPPNSLSGLSQKLGAPSTRSLVLWAVLIGGVLVLGGVAWAVMRQMKSTNKT